MLYLLLNYLYICYLMLLIYMLLNYICYLIFMFLFLFFLKLVYVPGKCLCVCEFLLVFWFLFVVCFLCRPMHVCAGGRGEGHVQKMQHIYIYIYIYIYSALIDLCIHVYTLCDFLAGKAQHSFFTYIVCVFHLLNKSFIASSSTQF